MTQSQRTVGWIGLGSIGLPMAARAAAAGWRVWGYDTSPAQRDAGQAANVEIGASAAEVGDRASDLVVCVVRTFAQVEDALFGDHGALQDTAPRLAVVMSSIGADGVSALAERATKIGAGILDAPILGNPAGAAAGSLTIAVSGSARDATAARPLLEDLASSVVMLGEEVGVAQTVKMVSQLRQIVGMIATIEGMELASRRGADERAVLEVLQATEPSWATNNWTYARELWAGRDRSTSLGIFAKDLAAAVADAETVGLDLPLVHEAHRLVESRAEGTTTREGHRHELNLSNDR